MKKEGLQEYAVVLSILALVLIAVAIGLVLGGYTARLPQ